MTRFCLTAALVFVASLAPAADWPQWRGPRRDDVSTETGLLKSWPKDGPKLLWTSSDCGVGYSGPAIVGDRVYCFGAEEAKDKEFVFALNLADGKLLWKTPIAREQPAKQFMDQWGGGPRCTPTVDGDGIYVLGAQGDLAALDAGSGQLRWQINVVKDLGGKLMSGWGYSESVLVDGDKVVCSPGGGRGTLAALDKKTGKVIWRSTGLTDAAAYSSIVPAEVGGIRQYVQQTGVGVAGVAAADGKLLWRQEGESYRTAVIPTPVVSGNYVYATSGYQAGCMLVKLTPDGAGGIKSEKVYSNRKVQNQHGGVVLFEGHVFGSNGMASGQKTLPWTCQDLLTGKVDWQQEKTLEPSGVTFADGHFYCLGQVTGTLVRLKASTAKYEEAGQFTIPKRTTRPSQSGQAWTHPVVAHGRLFLRDQELMFCYDLREQRAAK
jgi:outer membrane protein assembly factor BamB